MSTKRSRHTPQTSLAALEGWQLLKLAFRPGSAPRYHTTVMLQGKKGVHNEARCPDCQTEKISENLGNGRTRLERLEHRFGHAGGERLPVARRPYARRKQPRQQRFVEEVAPISWHELMLSDVEIVDAPVAGYEDRRRRYWICPMCRGWAQRLYPMPPIEGLDGAAGVEGTQEAPDDEPDNELEPPLPYVGCRKCARITYRSCNEGKRLITRERIEAALEAGPRRRNSPARLRYELRVLMAARELAQRQQHWEQRFNAALASWLAWVELGAERHRFRLARLRLALAKEQPQASADDLAAARDELRQVRKRKRAAQAAFEQARAAYERVTAAA